MTRAARNIELLGKAPVRVPFSDSRSISKKTLHGKDRHVAKDVYKKRTLIGAADVTSGRFQASGVQYADYSFFPFVFVRNLPTSTTTQQIRLLLSEISAPIHVKLIRDKRLKRPHFAFAFFKDDTAVANVIKQLNNTLFGGKRVVIEEGLSSTAETVDILAQKRTESTGLIAETLASLKDVNCISVELSPPLNLSPERAVDFITRLLPKSMRIVKVYQVRKKLCQWYFELPSVRDALSLVVAWKRVVIPRQALKGYLEKSEYPAKKEELKKGLVMAVSCVVPSVEKVAAAKMADGSQKNPAPLVIKNLSYKVNEQLLFHLLKSYGLIRKLRMSEPSNSSAPHGGYAFVSYKNFGAAKNAMEVLNGKLLCGKRLEVAWGVGLKTSAELAKGLTAVQKPDFRNHNPFNNI